MIIESKVPRALMAMQHLCVIARLFSTSSGEHENAFRILDTMDYLFSLLYSLDDRTSDFIQALSDSAESVPQCEEALRIFTMDSLTERNDNGE